MGFRPLLALMGALTLLSTPALTQETCTLDFYYDLLAEFNCDGFPLNSETIKAGECVDIATVVGPLGKPWAAFSGQSVPTGCSGMF